MEPKDLVTFSQKTASALCPEQDEFELHALFI
jgi:hypothetical protein